MPAGQSNYAGGNFFLPAETPGMYPVTHLHFLSRLTELSDQAVLGAVFPDTCIAGEITWEAAHRPGFAVRNCFSEEYRPFLLGLFTHTADPRGLDYYNDQKLPPHERGYSFLKAAPLVGGVQAACRLDEATALWKAHNFIEMGIENLIARENPHINRHLFEALQNRDLINRICGKLSGFFDKTPEQLAWGYFLLEECITQQPENTRRLAEAYQKQLEVKHQIDAIDVEAVNCLILQGQEIVKDDYREFLDFCLEKIKADLGDRL